jgi:hypothetical protein
MRQFVIAKERSDCGNLSPGNKVLVTLQAEKYSKTRRTKLVVWMLLIEIATLAAASSR